MKSKKSQINSDVIVGVGKKTNNTLKSTIAEPYLGGVQVGFINRKVGSTKKLFITGLVLAVLILLGLIVSGHLLVAWKQPKQHIIYVNKVCGADIISTYNKASQFSQRGSSEQYTLDEVGLKNLVTQIKAKKNYQDDATCQTILLEVAVYNQDYSAAKIALDAVKNLHQEYLYVDSNLKTTGSIANYEILVQELSPNQGGASKEPQGGA